MNLAQGSRLRDMMTGYTRYRMHGLIYVCETLHHLHENTRTDGKSREGLVGLYS